VKVWEIVETTSAGSIASVNSGFGPVIRRFKPMDTYSNIIREPEINKKKTKKVKKD